jgi:hypothetical protein
MFRYLLAALAGALLFPASAAAAFDDAAYWRLADRMQERLDSTWSQRAGYYKLGQGGVEPMANSMMLLAHSVAAMKGHTGPSRNDERARLLAAKLVSSGPFVFEPRPGQSHAPGWVNAMHGFGVQHLVFDAEVVDGLVYAYRARAALQLPETTVHAIREAISRTARGKFWRYPTIRLNQINWYAVMYAADATVTGDPALLRRDLSLQLRRFFSDVRGDGARAGNFGPGMRFHYLPGLSVNSPSNVDSSEYANIVLSFTRFYEQARRAGMPPLSQSARAALREWVRRAISGYWTHAGYLNWDAGLGFHRWHQAKKLGLSQGALVGLAAAPDSLLPSESWKRWAKSIFDRGLHFYDRLAARTPGGIPDPVLFDLNVVPQGQASARLGAARMLGNAARAVDAGLGRIKGSPPPPLYSYDPDTGRLAVTTPKYNTAIVPVNQRAFPYGGLDLARLFDSDQEVVANIGGLPPASFGLLVRDVAGRRVAATQLGRDRIPSSGRVLRLTRAPRGAGAVSSSRVGPAYAGAFSDLRATGTKTTRTLSMRVSHRFTRDWIETTWVAKRQRGRGRYTADVLFPSWGGNAAKVTAVLRGGRRVTLGSARVRLSSLSYLWVRSERSGYVVVPRSRPAGATVHALPAARQPSAPTPGPTAAIQLARRSRFSRVALTARLMPVHSAREAAAAATRLR